MKNLARFIVLEGIDGSGKDTILQKLTPLFLGDMDYSKGFNVDKYHSFLTTYEPTSASPSGRTINQEVNHLSLIPFKKFSKEEISNLYIKDRVHHCSLIQKALKNDTTVLCSRYDLSTYAYQGQLGSSFEKIFNAHPYGSSGKSVLIPDLTLFLNISYEVATERIQYKSQKDKDNYDLTPKDNIRKTIESYHYSIKELKKKQPSRKIVLIHAQKSIDEVLKDCIKEISNLFNQK